MNRVLGGLGVLIVAAFLGACGGSGSGGDPQPPPPPTQPPPPPQANRAPAITVSSTASVTENEAGAVVASVQISDADGDAVTVTVDDDRFEVSGGELRLKADQSLDYEAAASVEITITASDGEDSTTAQMTISVVDVNEDEDEVINEPLVLEGQQHPVPLFPSASEPMREGIVRIINHSGQTGEVHIHPTDESGRRFDALTLTLEARQTAHFDSLDLETGNPGRGLTGAAGAGQGDWRLILTSDLDIEVLAYIRAQDGFLTPVHSVAPSTGNIHRVATFSPDDDSNPLSRLRLINMADEPATVRIRGTDDGGAPGQEELRLRIDAGAARWVTAQQLENGGAGVDGMLGDGSGLWGFWRLEVESDQPIVVMSLLENPMGRVANLSAAAARPLNGVHHAPLFPASGSAPGQQGFVRVINRSQESGEVRIQAFDDTDLIRPPVTLEIGPNAAAHFNSDDLEQGGRPGFPMGVGSGQGDWRLELTSDLDIEVLAYIRAMDGFLAPVHDVAPSTGNIHRVVAFNPGGDMGQAGRLRLVNIGEMPAAATIQGIDNRGESPGDAFEVVVSARAAREFTAAELGLGDVTGDALGDGPGRWRLVVESVEPLMAMSLVENPEGQLMNLSATVPRVDPVLAEDHFEETMRGNAEGIDVSVVDGQGFEQGLHGQRITDIFLANSDRASLVQIGGWGSYELHGVDLTSSINISGFIKHALKHDEGIFWTATDSSPGYRPRRDYLDYWFVSGGRPFAKIARTFARWLRQTNVLMVSALENATCAGSVEGACDLSVYCDDFDSSAAAEDGWIPLCGELDDYIAHSGTGLDKVIFVGALVGDEASGAIRADSVYAPHTIYVESQDGSVSQATPVLAAYAANLAFSNPKWGAARIKRELMNLAREETVDYRPGAINSLGQSVYEKRTVKVIRPGFAPASRAGAGR